MASAPPPRPIAAVIGSGEDSLEALEIATRLGEALITNGFRLVTGGLGGIMAAASEGARRATTYKSGDVIGILPGYDKTAANPYVDVAVCTGMGHARNTLVVATADVVIAVGGRAGTLSEIALAWTLGKPVIAAKVPGWGARLAGEAIDDRSTNTVIGPLDVEDIAPMANRLISGLEG